MTHYAQFERFELKLTKDEARTGNHVGKCDDDIEFLSRKPRIARQLAKLDPEALRDELREYGAWDAEELGDHDQNLQRILWLACGNIVEDSQ